jgi:hypothetical protein
LDLVSQVRKLSLIFLRVKSSFLETFSFVRVGFRLFLPENISSSESLRPKIDGEDNAQAGYEKIVIGTNERKKTKIDQDA